MRHYVAVRQKTGRPRRSSAGSQPDGHRDGVSPWHSHPSVIERERAVGRDWVVDTVYRDERDLPPTLRHARCSKALKFLREGHGEDGKTYLLYFCSSCFETVTLSEESQCHVPRGLSVPR